MDLFNFYVTTARYIMSTDVQDKSSWSEIFKYLSSLRQMVSCCVCGNLAFRPHSPNHNVCLHLVCEGCVGGKMRLKPSCSWCKDADSFLTNRRARVVINCFKRLCLYISTSSLGQELSNSSKNGHGSEAEKVLKILEEVGEFNDEVVLTPPPPKMPKISKLVSQRLISPSRSTNKSISITQASTSSNIKSSFKASSSRGPRAKSTISKSLKVSKPKSNVALHVWRLKKKAMNTQVKRPSPKVIPRKRQVGKANHSSTFSVANRPHRDRSGKASIGQLWRETFLEEAPSEVVYPDSGIEIGSSNDQDQRSKSQEPITTESKTSNSKTEHVDIGMVPPYKETRSHGPVSTSVTTVHLEHSTRQDEGAGSSNQADVTSKPRLTLRISKNAVLGHPYSRRAMRSSADTSPHTKEVPAAPLVTASDHMPNLRQSKPFRYKKGRDLVKRHEPQVALEICKCARFKPPTQLTCFGQKCPCYSEKKACSDCLCNGCKNPLRISTDTAPPLMRFTKDGIEVPAHNRCMPRLSPIPRV